MNIEHAVENETKRWKWKCIQCVWDVSACSSARCIFCTINIDDDFHYYYSVLQYRLHSDEHWARICAHAFTFCAFITFNAINNKIVIVLRISQIDLVYTCIFAGLPLLSPLLIHPSLLFLSEIEKKIAQHRNNNNTEKENSIHRWKKNRDSLSFVERFTCAFIGMRVHEKIPSYRLRETANNNFFLFYHYSIK